MAFTKNNITKKPQLNELLVNSEEDKTPPQEFHFTMKLNNIVYKDEASNFYVISASLSSEEPNYSVKVNGEIFSARKFTIVGNSQIMQSMTVQQEFEVWGFFEPGKQSGSVQLSANSIQESIPTKPEAIKLFLSSGRIHGIGPGFAKKIVEKFGAKTISILDNSPDDLLEITGLNIKKLEGIKKSWKEWRAVYEIVSTMRMYDVGDVAGMKIFNHFKEDSINIIKNDPYLLTDVEGIGFKTADKIAQTIGIPDIDPKRIEKCILFTLEELAEKGHTAYPRDELIEKTRLNLNINVSYIKDKVTELINNEILITREINVKIKESKYSKKFYMQLTTVVAHKKFHSVEKRIAKELHRLINSENIQSSDFKQEVEEYLTANPFKLDDSQVNASRIILNNKVSILTGGPGTGKTHTLKSLLTFFNNVGRIVKVLNKPEDLEKSTSPTWVSVLSAPTGRAAKKMNESTKMPSSTIHRLLGFQEGKFVHNELNQLEGDVFITDEYSMVDIFLAAASLKAIPNHAKLILVGDIEQLSSVGAGEVLKDFVNSGAIAIAPLKKIHRQAENSGIILAAHDIINERVPQLYDYDSKSDFVFIESAHKDNDETYEIIIGVVKELLAKKVNPNDIQVLTPKKEAQLGVYEINRALRLLLNPYVEDYEESKMKFIPGDRVMQLKNNKDLDIFNGDIGYVTKIDEEDGIVTVDFDDKKVKIEGKDISNLILAYACTIHKSQGSEYPYVIIPISHSHSFMWDTNLLYTAVTRGKQRVILVGDRKTLQMSVATFKQTERITTLREELIEQFNIKEDNSLLLPNQIEQPHEEDLFNSLGNDRKNKNVFNATSQVKNSDIEIVEMGKFKRRKINLN